MADNMMRMAGRGDDGTAKSLKSDNSGILKIKQTPVSLDTLHHNAATASGNGLTAVVAGYSSIGFHVFGSFVGRVYFEGNINPGVWQNLPVVNEFGVFVPFATKHGIYKADISGYREVRARVEWTSGTSVTVRSLATLSGSTKDMTVSMSRQNALLYTSEDAFHLNKPTCYYGDFVRGSTDIAAIKPVNYSDHSKKTLFVSNKFNEDMRIVNFYKYTQLSNGADYFEEVDVDILIPSGKVGRLSFTEYPELLDPFLGLAVKIQASTFNPTSGTIKLQWMGGN